MAWIRRLLLPFFSIIVVLGLFSAYNLFFLPLNLADKDEFVLVIDKDTTAKKLTSKLKNERLYSDDRLLLTYLKLTGKSKQIKTGIYVIQKSESVAHLIKRIVAFDVLQKTFKIIAGTTNSQIAKNLQAADYLKYSALDWEKVFAFTDELKIVCAEDPSRTSPTFRSADCLNALRFISKPQDVEGLFLADTYKYDAGSSAISLLTNANANLKSYLFKAWEHRKIGLPYGSPYELLIAASILEKESANKEERRLISGVIVNRLNKKMPLQMDPTVIYGLQERYTGKLGHDDLQIPSKYNTYKNKGLPPTPIAAVSKDAIDAASNPESTDYLYFVATGNGTHVFSKTYAEQRAAIQKYHRNLDEQ